MKRLSNLKNIVTIVLLLLLIMLTPIKCFAHPTAAEHNDELERVLFGIDYSGNDEQLLWIKEIEYASYLTIDQFQGNGTNQYEYLKSMKVKGLPKFKDIDYSEDLQGNGKKIVANTHRRITHQGWVQEGGTKSTIRFWNNRRQILLATTDEIFDFDGKKKEKQNAFCGIIYYTHVLGDYLEADKNKKVDLLIDIAGHENTDGNDICSYLSSYVETLFRNQKKTKEYQDFNSELGKIQKRASKLVRKTGGIQKESDFDEYHKCAEDLMSLLQKNIPTLLKNEKFFNEIFYL